jgi:hypothetical protein
MLIEDLYVKTQSNIEKILKSKVNDLSNYQKKLLGLEDFSGVDDSNVYDACFVLIIPPQMMVAKYRKFIQ